jgi:hypothetical protein
MSDNVKAAIIGAISALIVTLIKDVIIDEIRRSKESKKALIDRRLAELYSPLWVALGGGANTLVQILSDDLAYQKLTTNFHLLSKDLRELFQEFMKLGRGNDVRHPEFTVSDQRKMIALHEKIIPVLKSEIEGLRKEYYEF